MTGVEEFRGAGDERPSEEEEDEPDATRRPRGAGRGEGVCFFASGGACVKGTDSGNERSVFWGERAEEDEGDAPPLSLPLLASHARSL